MASDTNFMTLYTDASFSLDQKRAVVAYYGFCNRGTIKGALSIPCGDNNIAEMEAFRYAILHALEVFPEVEGFFVNSDSKVCVEEFWEFKAQRHTSKVRGHAQEVRRLLSTRWIRTKWVKGHSSSPGIRTILNNVVDKLARKKSNFRVHTFKE